MMLTLKRTEIMSPLLVNIRESGRNESYSCVLTVCENPVCTCSSVGFFLRPFPGRNSGYTDDEERESVSFSLDLSGRAIDESKRTLDERSRYYAKLFIGGLREADWELLQQEYVAHKTRLTETADPATLETNFPVLEIADGAMVPYHEILPFGKRISFTLDEDDFFVGDQYCVKEGCTCVECSLSFVPWEKRWLLREKNLLENVFVDYRKRKWDYTKSVGKTSFSRTDLQAALEHAYPDIYKVLYDRHQEMKKLYRIFKDKHPAPEPVSGLSSLKVGRNAPCPCGSGKKYKRCCG